jgi:hypothetical protein
MVCIDFFADSSRECFMTLRYVGKPISMRTVMIAMTISNSINVKPLGRKARQVRHFHFLQFMGLQFLWEQPKDSGPFEKILQRMDAKGK